MLRGRKILVAVTGGIAAYKSCELVRLLMKNGASVHVLMTEAATKFVAPMSFEALSGRAVASEMFPPTGTGSGHLDLARHADLLVIAPATANSIAKLAWGLAYGIGFGAGLGYTLHACRHRSPSACAGPVSG